MVTAKTTPDNAEILTSSENYQEYFKKQNTTHKYQNSYITELTIVIKYDNMLIFDAVIYNEDRHFGNFGLLRDNHTGEFTGTAPIFDNGLSLFNFAMPDDLKNLDDYAKTRTTPYRISFEDVCRAVMSSKQKNQLRKLVNFTFTRHPSINLPEERLQAIENHIQKRVRELLAIPNAK